MISGGLIVGMGAWESAFYAFFHSDAVGKVIVLLLWFFSVVTWAIMLDKGVALKRVNKLSEKFSAKFKKSPSLTDSKLYSDSTHDPGPLALVYRAGSSKLLVFYGSPDGRPVPPTLLTAPQREAIRTVLEHSVTEQISQLEEGIPRLALAVSASPLFGLFGTVWGVMAAFCGAAVAGRADISALAPGISGALLTTVVGLIVAIPSLFGYNILAGSVRKATVAIDDFVEDFMTRLALEQLDLEEAEKRRNPPPPAQPPIAPSAYEQAQVVMPLKSVLMARSRPAQADEPEMTQTREPGAAKSPLEPAFRAEAAPADEEDTGRRQSEIPFGSSDI